MIKTCSVCYDTKQSFKKVGKACVGSQCSSVCEDCKYRSVKGIFEAKMVPEINCPFCKKHLEYEEITSILKFGAKNLNDSTALERFERITLHYTLQKMPEFVWCSHDCGSGQLNEGGLENVVVKCIACNKKTCFKHKIHFHEGYTCAEYDRLKQVEEVANETAIRQIAKQCPKCSYWIEKGDGCSHMTCKCGYEFCYQCLADFDCIRKDGNHKHKTSCAFYFPYDP